MPIEGSPPQYRSFVSGVSGGGEPYIGFGGRVRHFGDEPLCAVTRPVGYHHPFTSCFRQRKGDASCGAASPKESTCSSSPARSSHRS